MIDVTKVYDERGFNLTHLCSQNNDHTSLDILITYIFGYWEKKNQDVSRSMSLSLLYEWVNEPSRSHITEHSDQISPESKQNKSMTSLIVEEKENSFEKTP